MSAVNIASIEEYNLAWLEALSEHAFQLAIVEHAGAFGWHHIHVGDSNRDDPGRPDLTLGHRRWQRLIVMEIKKTGGATKAAQRVWLDFHADAGIEAYLVYPRHWVEVCGLLALPNPPDAETLDCSWKARTDDEHNADLERMLRDKARNKRARARQRKGAR